MSADDRAVSAQRSSESSTPTDAAKGVNPVTRVPERTPIAGGPYAIGTGDAAPLIARTKVAVRTRW
jgi:hypothetical protein